MLKWICYICYYLLGWTFDPSLNTLKSELTKSKNIILIPHTCFFDGIIGFLAAWAFDFTPKFLVLDKYYNFILKNFGFIPVNGTQGPQGTIDKLSQQLPNQFNLFMSPEGTRKKTLLRTGAFYLAKCTGANLHVVNLDYEAHNIKYVKTFTHAHLREWTEQDYHNLVTPCLGYYSPMFPENTIYCDLNFIVPKTRLGGIWSKLGRFF